MRHFPRNIPFFFFLTFLAQKTSVDIFFFFFNLVISRLRIYILRNIQFPAPSFLFFFTHKIDNFKSLYNQKQDSIISSNVRNTLLERGAKLFAEDWTVARLVHIVPRREISRRACQISTGTGIEIKRNTLCYLRSEGCDLKTCHGIGYWRPSPLVRVNTYDTSSVFWTIVGCVYQTRWRRGRFPRTSIEISPR